MPASVWSNAPSPSTPGLRLSGWRSAGIRTKIGSPDLAIEHLEAPIRLDPVGPDRPLQMLYLAVARFEQGRFADAVPPLREFAQSTAILRTGLSGRELRPFGTNERGSRGAGSIPRHERPVPRPLCPRSDGRSQPREAVHGRHRPGRRGPSIGEWGRIVSDIFISYAARRRSRRRG